MHSQSQQDWQKWLHNGTVNENVIQYYTSKDTSSYATDNPCYNLISANWQLASGINYAGSQNLKNQTHPQRNRLVINQGLTFRWVVEWEKKGLHERDKRQAPKAKKRCT